MNELMGKTYNKYSLVYVVSVRAREIIDGSPALVENEELNPVSTAVKEVMHDKVTFYYKDVPPEEAQGEDIQTEDEE